MANPVEIVGVYRVTPSAEIGTPTRVAVDVDGNVKTTGAASMYPIATKPAAPVSITVSQTVTAELYATGEAVGGKLTLTGLGNAGAITKVVIRDKAAQNVAYELWLFDADPTTATITNGAAFAVSATDLPKVVAVIPVAGLVSGGTGGGVITAASIYVPFNLASGTVGYAALVVRGAPTYASTTDISVTVVAEPAAA